MNGVNKSTQPTVTYRVEASELNQTNDLNNASYDVIVSEVEAIVSKNSTLKSLISIFKMVNNEKVATFYHKI